MALLVFGLAPCLALAAGAEPADDGEFSALQAEAKKTFRDQVTPFVRTYCLNCHGNRKTKGGVNFEPALKAPGNAAFSQRWKQALANVKAHDMPPEDAAKQPTDAERRERGVGEDDALAGAA